MYKSQLTRYESICVVVEDVFGGKADYAQLHKVFRAYETNSIPPFWCKLGCTKFSPGGHMTVEAIPEGYHTLTPYMTVRDAARAIEFYKQAFGAVEKGVMKHLTAKSCMPS